LIWIGRDFDLLEIESSSIHMDWGKTKHSLGSSGFNLLEIESRLIHIDWGKTKHSRGSSGFHGLSMSTNREKRIDLHSACVI
jgi:predicted DNA-binding WGR domain protein